VDAVRLEILEELLVLLSTRVSKADDCISKNVTANGTANDEALQVLSRQHRKINSEQVQVIH
jgi:hypothetical protein